MSLRRRNKHSLMFLILGADKFTQQDSSKPKKIPEKLLFEQHYGCFFSRGLPYICHADAVSLGPCKVGGNFWGITVVMVHGKILATHRLHFPGTGNLQGIRYIFG